MRSSGVVKRRRSALAAPFGPSFGKRTSELARVAPERFVMPLVRVAKAYEPRTRIGPETFLTSTRAELLTTSATSNSCVDGFFMYFELRQRRRNLLPRFSGR